jgi:hypothetical protein
MNNSIFDYKFIGKNRNVPQAVLDRFEHEAAQEFPFDKMLMEIHILRAINHYTRTQNIKKMRRAWMPVISEKRRCLLESDWIPC